MKKIAIVLSGCGSRDGSEITEAVSVLLALSELNVAYQIFAPQLRVPTVSHISGKTQSERDVLEEAARIARGNINPLSQLKADDFDGLVFPGGFGVARNLCTWASEGASCQVLPEAKRVIEEFFSQTKPICAICIAPALIARVLGHRGITLTLGEEGEASQELLKTGAHHAKCAVQDYISDRDSKIISTPAYMFEAKPFQVYTGIRKAVRELVEMA